MPISIAAKFTSAPGTEGGKSSPTIFWPDQTGFNRRARKTVRTRAEPKLTFAFWASAIANRNGCTRAVRTNARGNVFIRDLR